MQHHDTCDHDMVTQPQNRGIVQGPLEIVVQGARALVLARG